MNCPVCDETAVSVQEDLWDDLYGYPGQFALMQCPNCGHAFLDCVLSPNQLAKLYTSYYPRKTFEMLTTSRIQKKEVDYVRGWTV